MFLSIWNDVRAQLDRGNMVTKLIVVNLIVFFAIALFRLVLFIASGAQNDLFYSDFIHLISLPGDIGKLILQPWSIVTHMFLHEGFFHILFNLLYLYWFGTILGDLIGDKKILPIYLFSGLCGALVLMLLGPFIYKASPVYAMGASAAVMGICTAAATIAPDYEISLLIIGRVKLKYLVFFLVLFDLISIPTMVNSGGHIAHLGGAAGGVLFIFLLRQGIDLSEIKWTKKTKTDKPRMTVVHSKVRQNQTASQIAHAPNGEAELNRILEKIKSKGADSLNKKEKDFLDQIREEL